MRAAAEDFEMARVMGVRANRVVGVAFAIAGFSAAAAAFLLAVQTGYVSPTTGLTPVLYAFIATILGGVGSLVGPVIAGFILGSLTVVLQVTLPQSWLPYRDAFGLCMRVSYPCRAPAGNRRGAFANGDECRWSRPVGEKHLTLPPARRRGARPLS